MFLKIRTGDGINLKLLRNIFHASIEDYYIYIVHTTCRSDIRNSQNFERTWHNKTEGQLVFFIWVDKEQLQ
jgi:hypothetical protein